MSTLIGEATHRFSPLNLEEEKKKFFFDQEYNPQFEYRETIQEVDLLRYGDPSDALLGPAKKILDSVLQTFGTEAAFYEKTKGEPLDLTTTTTIIREYLKLNNIEEMVKLVFSDQFVARTSLKRNGHQFTLNIRTPLTYRSKSLTSVLHHEIGTHLFRWLNEMRQPWFENRSQSGFHDYLVTEEGLATLHSLINQEHPYLWSAALNYFCVVEGSRSSFAELYKKLQRYVDDSERRWQFCLKVKRGVEDTSTPGVYTKNQMYFSGVVQVLRWLTQNAFAVEKLYYGKIALEDIDMAVTQATTPPVLPVFLSDRQDYQKRLLRVLEINKLQV